MKKLISIILSLMFVLCLLPLQVFAAPITKVEVTGIDAPVVGESPDMNAVAGDGYYNHANRVQWKEYNENKIYQRDLTASDTFRAGYYYAVFVTVFTNTDMPFIPQTIGTVNGKSAQTQELQDNGCSIVVIYNFAEILKEPVKELELTIPAPVDGEKPDYTKLDGNSYYSDNGLNGTSTRIYKNGIAWYKSTTSVMTPGTGETFRADTDYQLKISLMPKEGYFFHENISVTINGKPATVEIFDDGSINASVTLKAAAPAHTHTPSEWRTTGAYHYKACTTCGEFLDQEDHKGGVATCAEKGKCTVCGYEYIDVHENHTPDTSKWVIRGDMYHYHACKLCGAHCDIGEHVAGPAGTPDAAVVCKDCGYIITPAKDHTHTSSGWHTTGAYHYKTCTVCGDMLDQEDHKGGVATCSEKGKCTVCGYAYLAENEMHNPDTSKWTACGNLYHAHLCKDCGAHCDAQDHVAGPTGTPDAAVMCKDCGYIITPAKNHTHNLTKVAKKGATCTEPGNVEYYTCDGCSDFFADSEGKSKITNTVIAPLGHKISDDWKHDENNHWRTCTVCNEVLTETQMVHEMNGEKCTTCNYDGNKPNNMPSNPTETTPNSTVPQQQDKGNGGMPWWSLLLIGLGAVVVGIIVGVFMLKQKKKV